MVISSRYVPKQTAIGDGHRARCFNPGEIKLKRKFGRAVGLGIADSGVGESSRVKSLDVTVEPPSAESSGNDIREGEVLSPSKD